MQFMSSKVIERMGGLSRVCRASVQSRGKEEGEYRFAYVATMAGNSRLYQALKASALQAQSQMLQYVKVT